MDIEFFDRPNLRIGRVEWSKNKYKHTFGGPAYHEGIIVPKLNRPAHLLLRLDLKDPALGFKFPGLRWLPIYFVFHSGRFCYRVLSDERVEIFNMPFAKGVPREIREFYDKFPVHLGEDRVSISTKLYDPHDVDMLVNYGRIFGGGMLKVKEKKQLKEYIEDEQPGLIFDPEGEPPYDSFEDLLDVLSSLVLHPLGYPQEIRCPNPACPDQSKAAEMTFWMQMRVPVDDDEDDEDYNDYDEDEDYEEDEEDEDDESDEEVNEPDEEEESDENDGLAEAIGAFDNGRLRVFLCLACNTVCVTNPST